MHSIYHRASNIASLLSTCVCALLVAVALSTFVLQVAPPPAKVNIKSLDVKWNGQSYYHKGQPAAQVKFDLKADLTPLFNWNTKQVFVYLVAEYTNAQGVNNKVVLWDRIVRRRKDAVIAARSRTNKYIFRDPSRSFKNVSEATFMLEYNIMPYVGVLTSGEVGRTLEPMRFPDGSKGRS
ncbi:hypothetical protein BOTBODRAFT_34702 [Botryobasidium botryosum FD-172 SS1]|uniref:Signal peptidase subunit 3 n=1 Tax=Botryobasidium botryosum (strain FD-172 SS1) TaxID=930990 RepID=A0A067MBL2_BOTB1|nr:hypothetical protein BOTBODRAFT_34702 [Botryobasidium botryosum FD-172 SS1]